MRARNEVTWNRARLVLLLCAFIGIGWAGPWGCAAREPGGGPIEAAPQTTDSISQAGARVRLEIQRALYFEDPADGSAVAVEPGDYEIAPSTDATIRLMAADGKAYTVSAQQGTHTEKLPEPLVLADETGEDEVHIVILFEDGRSLDAAASYTGVVERGRARRRVTLSRERVARARMRYPATKRPAAARRPPKRAPKTAGLEKGPARPAAPPLIRPLRIGRYVRPPERRTESPEPYQPAPQEALPQNFDLRVRYPYHPEPKNQGGCGSCYLVASVAVAEWAYAIDQQERGIEADPKVLSAQAVMDCGSSAVRDFSCLGGWPLDVYQFIEEHGVPLADAYRPYAAQDGPCQGYVPYVWFTGGSSTVHRPDPAEMRREIHQGRPVTFTMKIFTDFYAYAGGIYRHVEGAYVGMSSMVAIGWGTEGGTRYWIVANTWGRGWGDRGYFKVAVDDESIADTYATYHTGIRTTPPSSATSP